jgi:hypothetical protein
MSRIIAALLLDEKTVIYIIALERGNQIITLAGRSFVTRHWILERKFPIAGRGDDRDKTAEQWPP